MGVRHQLRRCAVVAILWLHAGFAAEVPPLALPATRGATPPFVLEADKAEPFVLKRISNDTAVAFAGGGPRVRLVSGNGWNLESLPAEVSDGAGASFVVYRGDRAVMLRDLAANATN
jgi:hypothetical protein